MQSWRRRKRRRRRRRRKRRLKKVDILWSHPSLRLN